MPELVERIDVDAPPERVWAVLTDWEAQSEWMLATDVRTVGWPGAAAARPAGGPHRAAPPRRPAPRHPGHDDHHEVGPAAAGRGAAHRAAVRGPGIFEIEARGEGSTFFWTERLYLPYGYLGSSAGSCPPGRRARHPPVAEAVRRGRRPLPVGLAGARPRRRWLRAIEPATAVSRRGWALFLTMSVIWGIPYLLIKVAVDEVSPVTRGVRPLRRRRGPPAALDDREGPAAPGAPALAGPAAVHRPRDGRAVAAALLRRGRPCQLADRAAGRHRAVRRGARRPADGRRRAADAGPHARHGRSGWSASPRCSASTSGARNCSRSSPSRSPSSATRPAPW